MASFRTEQELARHIGSFKHDAYGFVMFVFPWGVKGSELANKEGPNKWQRELLEAVSLHSYNNELLAEMGLDMNVWRSAVASGHGVGKSAVVAWIIYWLMSTRFKTRGAVTASTSGQLETKTWPELAKWHSLAINRHWFNWTSTSFSAALLPPEEAKNWMTTAATVSSENTEAFAGLHNEGKTVFIIEDEASGVEPKISEIAHGAFTDGEGFWFKFGNPTKPDGPFADCFTKQSKFWHCVHVDSREVPHTNKKSISDTLAIYGPDSDEARVRVYGRFPTKAYDGFIAADTVREAQMREVRLDSGAALIMAVDVARFGDDETVFCFRQGRDARSIPSLTFKGLSTTRVAEIMVEQANKWRPDAIVVEGTGIGAGVIDQARDNHRLRIIEVHPGAHARRPEIFANRRAEMWSMMRDWIQSGAIPNDSTLFEQIVTMRYTLGAEHQKMQMETKKSYKERNGFSPDRADALVLTFGTEILRRDVASFRPQRDSRRLVEYDELAA